MIFICESTWLVKVLFLLAVYLFMLTATLAVLSKYCE